MPNAFFEAICRMGIFMICVRAILHFRPQEVYEKYLRLLAGIMILIQLFLPVGRLILGNGGQEAAEVLEDFRQQLQRGMEEAVEDAEVADALLEQMTLEEVQRRLEEQKAAQEEETGQERRRWEEGTGQERGGWREEIESADKGEAENKEDRITVDVKPVEPVFIGPAESEAQKEETE